MTKVEIDNYKKALVEVEAVLDCREDDAYRKIPEVDLCQVFRHKSFQNIVIFKFIPIPQSI